MDARAPYPRRTRYGGQRSADDPDALSLRALLTGRDLELDPLTVAERLVAIHGDGREVHEHVLATVYGDEAVTFFTVEPLHRAFNHRCIPTLVLRASGQQGALM